MIGRWRSHVHVTALARIDRDQWEPLFHALADAAREHLEPLTCVGSLDTGWSTPIGRFEVTGYRMRRGYALALRDRVATALRGQRPVDSHIIYTPRCRCNGDRGGIDAGLVAWLAFVVAVVLAALGVFGQQVAP